MGNEKTTKGRIIIILKKHLLEEVSINEFIEMTDILNLEDLNKKLRDLIVEDAKKSVSKMQFDENWELSELLDDDVE